MKKFRPLLLLVIALGMIAASSSPAYCQVNCSLLQVNNAAGTSHASNMSNWFGVMELPFLFIAVLFAFLTAYALKGGRFGKWRRSLVYRADRYLGIVGIGFLFHLQGQ